MARKKPNIYVGNVVKKRDRLSFKNFVLEIIEDTFIFEFTPTSISLNGELFTLVLDGIQFVYEDLQVDSAIDYLDVFLYGVQQPKDRYSVTFDETSVTISFNQSITLQPNLVVKEDFDVKGKLKEIE